jgi:hypothetical protein
MNIILLYWTTFIFFLDYPVYSVLSVFFSIDFRKYFFPLFSSFILIYTYTMYPVNLIFFCFLRVHTFFYDFIANALYLKHQYLYLRSFLNLCFLYLENLFVHTSCLTFHSINNFHCWQPKIELLLLRIIFESSISFF